MSEELPVGWARVRMGEVFDCWGGMTPSTSEAKYWGGGMPWVSSKDVKGRVVEGGTEYVTERALTENRLRKCPVGSVLVVVRSGVLVHTLPVAITSREVVVNQDVKALDSGDVDLNAWAALHLRATQQEILEQNRKDGTTVQSIRVPELLDRELTVPPLAEQHRIVARVEALLEQVRRAKDRLDRVLLILRRFRQAVLTAACTGDLTEQWRIETGSPAWRGVALADLAASLSYGTAAKSSKEGRMPVLRMGNIQDGSLDWSDLAFTSDSAEIDKYRLRAGDVLFNRTNSPQLVGKAAVYRGERPAIYAGYLIRVRCSELLLPDFLNFCLGSPNGRDYCQQVKTDGVSQSNINAAKLAAFTFDLPCVAEQTEIVRRVGALFALAAVIEQRVEQSAGRVGMLTQTILIKAFSGELVPSEAELALAEGRDYETADQLLERVRTRSAEPTAKKKRVGAAARRRPRGKSKT